MNHKVQTAEKKEASWSAHNCHTCMNVCMHEINKTASVSNGEFYRVGSPFGR